jgi:hypothetical protein
MAKHFISVLKVIIAWEVMMCLKQLMMTPLKLGANPINLEFPINSPDDDILFVTDSLEKTAFFSTGRYSPLANWMY